MTPEQLHLYAMVLIFLVALLALGFGLLGIALIMRSSRTSRDEEWARQAGEAILRGEARPRARKV